MDIGKPERPSHLHDGTMLSFGDKPEDTPVEYRLARLVDAVNLVGKMHTDLQVAFLLLVRTLARQPGFDREKTFADFMAVAEEHYRTPHPDVVSPMLKTVGWFLRNA